MSLSPSAVLLNDTVNDTTPVFNCGTDGIVLVTKPLSATTRLNLTFSYLAQINDTTLDDALLDALELLFLKSAVGAALGCNVTTKRRLLTEYKHIDSSTDVLGKCRRSAMPFINVVLGLSFPNLYGSSIQELAMPIFPAQIAFGWKQTCL
jgi:hypothetical protein